MRNNVLCKHRSRVCRECGKVVLRIKGSGSHLQSQNVRLDKTMVCRSKYHAETLLKD